MSAAAIDLWWFALAPPGAEALARAVACLGAEERGRLRRFDRPEAAGLFALRRAVRRVILAEYLQAGAGEIVFDEAPGAKPRLRLPATDCEFNASDTAGLGVVAVTRGMEVGADVEAGRAVNMAGFARRILTPAEGALLREVSDAGERQRMLLRAWTAREAVLKGIGRGLDLDAMRHIGVAPVPGPGGWQDVSDAAGAGPGQGWHVLFRDLPVPGSAPAIAAVACRSPRKVEVRSAAALIARHGLA